MAELGTIECKLDNCFTDADGSVILMLRTYKANAYAVKQIAERMRLGQEQPNKRLTAAFAWKRQKRSLNANAYFHVLVNKIADKLEISESESKKMLVFEYGAPAVESDERIMLKLPKSANVEAYYPYAKWMRSFIDENGNTYNEYLLYKQTHTLDKREMARLIDGAVYSAKELGIDTNTAAYIERLKQAWGENKT